MQHVIKKQILSLGLSGTTDAFRIQQVMSDHYHRDVLHWLELVFDELSTEEEVIEVDRLEIDLGMFSEKEFCAYTWDETILNKIREQLAQKLAKQAKSETSIRAGKSMSVCRQWLFYMQYGYLPWNASNPDTSWYDRVLEALAVDFNLVSALRSLIATQPILVQRITLQHNTPFLLKLTELLTAQPQKQLPEAIDEVASLLSLTRITDTSSGGVQEIRMKLWRQIIQLAGNGGDTKATFVLIENLLKANFSDFKSLRSVMAEVAIKTPVILPVLKSIEGNPLLFNKNTTTNQTAQEAQLTGKEAENVFDPDGYTDESGIFVRQAGVVLVHAFLPALFERLRLIQNGKFVHKEARQRALYLLHYVSTGKGYAEEHELAVAKILCAWAVNMPVDRSVELAAAECDEADSMLQVVIEQWKVLKHTTADGLREGFLQRAGKLFEKNNQFFLQVESSPVDVLLDQLPWTLSFVKLPWMNEILRVDWR